jgi:hypothetical protein
MPGILNFPDDFETMKNTTDHFLSIDIRRWKREGLLVPGLSFKCQWSQQSKTITVIHVYVESGRLVITHGNITQPVYLTTTATNFNGERPWFVCPCGKRVAILYIRESIACRRCYRLAYKTQYKSERERMMMRADKIRSK